MGGEELLRKESRKERWEGRVSSSSRRGRFFSSKICLPFRHFSHFSFRLFTGRKGRGCFSERFLREIALGGKKEDFGRGINKYVNTFPVEEDSSKEGFIPDRRSKRSDINCFEARIGMRFSFSLPPQKVAKKQRFEDYKIRKRPFLPLINLLVETSCWGEIIYHRTSFSSPSSLFSFVTKKDSYLQDDS